MLAEVDQRIGRAAFGLDKRLERSHASHSKLSVLGACKSTINPSTFSSSPCGRVGKPWTANENARVNFDPHLRVSQATNNRDERSSFVGEKSREPMFRSRGARERKKTGEVQFFIHLFIFFLRRRARNKHRRRRRMVCVCLFRCARTAYRALNHGFQVMCMPVRCWRLFSLSLSLVSFFVVFFCCAAPSYPSFLHARMQTRVDTKERERESERVRESANEKSNTSTKARSPSLCMRTCVSLSVGPRRPDSSSRSFVYHSRYERNTTIECNLISSSLANQCACRKVERARVVEKNAFHL